MMLLASSGPGRARVSWYTQGLAMAIVKRFKCVQILFVVLSISIMLPDPQSSLNGTLSSSHRTPSPRPPHVQQEKGSCLTHQGASRPLLQPWPLGCCTFLTAACVSTGGPGGERLQGRRAGRGGALPASPEWERKLRVKILLANPADSLTCRKKMS